MSREGFGHTEKRVGDGNGRLLQPSQSGMVLLPKRADDVHVSAATAFAVQGRSPFIVDRL